MSECPIYHKIILLHDDAPYNMDQIKLSHILSIISYDLYKLAVD